MNVTIGKAGLAKTYQAHFKEVVECHKCNGIARIGFVTCEEPTKDNVDFFVCDLHENKGKGGYWLHDCCAVAVYFCQDCLSATALWNQG